MQNRIAQISHHHLNHTINLHILFYEFQVILKKPILTAIELLENQEKKFDLIFLDPPYNKGLIKKVLHRLDPSDIVRLFGTIVVGHSSQESLPKDLETLSHQRSIKIGQSFVSFLVKGNIELRFDKRNNKLYRIKLHKTSNGSFTKGDIFRYIIDNKQRPTEIVYHHTDGIVSRVHYY